MAGSYVWGMVAAGMIQELAKIKINHQRKKTKRRTKK
jgi:hypothetical protein